MVSLFLRVFFASVCLSLTLPLSSWGQGISEERLDELFVRFPDADLNGDARLSLEEAKAYRDQMRSGEAGKSGRGFTPDPGWKKERFPDHAVSYRSPEEIRELYAGMVGEQKAVVSFPKPTDGSLRIIGTGHSFMAPGYRTLKQIGDALDSQQSIYNHIGGGIKGSTRYKWEEENGIFQFDGEPVPKLLASLSNAEWDVMLWGPYIKDEPDYYTCWMDYALKYQPRMKFYLEDAWPQLANFDPQPKTEADMTYEVFEEIRVQRNRSFAEFVGGLRDDYGDRIYIMPTSDAFTRLAQRHTREPLPGVEGIHRLVGGKKASIWRDQIGHVGHEFEALIGYVFYATLYQKNPMDLPKGIALGKNGEVPNPELDEIFREIAWEAVINHPLSGVTVEESAAVAD